MPHIYAITGKGGVGKTTIAGLLVSALIKKEKTPVLAVDADPNSCLDKVLGVNVVKSIGRIREEARDESAKGLSSGISKQQLIELKISESLVEAENFDLIAMGRPEGPGCYCYANNVLKTAMSQITVHYPYVVLDNEAGLENLSRRLVQSVDVLIIVTDPSAAGMETVRRLHELAKEMDISYNALAIIVNRLRRDALPETAQALKNSVGANMLLGIPDDSELAECAENGRNIMELAEANPAGRKIDQFLELIS